MGKRLTFGAYPLPLFRHKALRVAHPEEEEMSVEERMRGRAAEAADEAGGVPPENWRVIGDLIRALPLEGEQGEPAKDQRGAPDDAAMPNKNSEHIGAKQPSGSDNNVIHPATAPHHHSRPEQFEWVEIGFNARLDAEPAPAREPAVEEVNAAKKEGCFITAVGSYYQNVVGLDVALRHAEELDRLRAENAEWRTWGVIEVAVRNPSVAEHMRHWEGRATKAEAENAAWGECWKAVREMCGDPLDSPNKPLATAATVAILHQSCAALREQLKGGVVVPREPTLDWLREFCRHPALDSLDGTEDIQDAVRIILNALAAAKEAKNV